VHGRWLRMLREVGLERICAQHLLLCWVDDSMSAALPCMHPELPSDARSIIALLLHRLCGADCGVEAVQGAILSRLWFSTHADSSNRALFVRGTRRDLFVAFCSSGTFLRQRIDT
jgi:hypothetical protein